MSEAEEAQDSPVDWVAQHTRHYLDTGRTGDQLGLPALLLTTRGRRSGKWRRTVLYYGEDSDRYLLVPSNSGLPGYPAWYLNLLEHPEVRIQIGLEPVFTACARLATAEEQPPLWATMVSMLPDYETYRSMSGRDFPVVILQRT
ncbi:nitroreductase family deazaflavin-dependent oxidoreductase [Actinopolymorpha sp. B11F2]|uniref:nitroreductase family deazaflavin-dependent oxidoreductase n=1 Tax=Actinopolymorpha sp. B11F2 TaxID=3160862 RepID=UPI0032E3D00D